MIIRFPTGLYRTILPSETGSGNITYTISSQDPPARTVRSIQLPVAERLRPLPSPTFDLETRRASFGELVYTLSKANRSDPGSNTKQFEVGEALEFEDDPTVNTPVFTAAPRDVEIQHNTNLLDLDQSGLTEDEIAEVVLESERRQRELDKQFSTQQSELQSIETNIRENQKQINEVNKAIRATRAAFNIPDEETNPTNEILVKLLNRRVELQNVREQLISDQNTKSAEVETTYRDLLRVSQLVR